MLGVCITLLWGKLENSYSIELRIKLNNYGVELRAVEMCDLPLLRRWRNRDDIRLQMMQTDYISPNQQRNWFESIQYRNDQQHWVLWCKGQRAGYVNLKGKISGELFGQDIADAGIYLGPSAVRHPMLAVAAALSQLDFGFETLQIKAIRTLVKNDNHSALRLNQQLGYQVLLNKQDFIALELLPSDYFIAREKLRRFFR